MSPILATIATLTAITMAVISAWMRHRHDCRARDRAHLHRTLADRFPWMHIYADADHALREDPNTWFHSVP